MGFNASLDDAFWETPNVGFDAMTADSRAVLLLWHRHALVGGSVGMDECWYVLRRCRPASIYVGPGLRRWE